MFLNNRHYDPTTGIFISVDPLVTATMQPYIYGAANPITYSDPDGLQPCATSACPDGIPVVQNGKPDHRAWRWTRLQEAFPNSPSRVRELFDLDKPGGPLPSWGLPGNAEGPTERRYSFTFEVSDSSSPEELADLFISECQFVFPVRGCSSNFEEGDRLNLYREQGQRGRIDAPVEVSNIFDNGVRFTALDGHPEGAGSQISFRFVSFEDLTYLKVDAWGPGNFLTETPIIADINFLLVERTWTSLANNIRGRAR